MDLTGLTALDVAIGLAFMFLLLSTIVSAIQEMVAGWLGWRAQELRKALRNWLAPGEAHDAATPDAEAVPAGADALAFATGAEAKLEAFLDKPRIKPLLDLDRGDKTPSYISARAAALTALDTWAGEVTSNAPPAGTPANADLIASLKAQAQNIPYEPVRIAVLDALNAGRASIDDFRKEVEKSFDEVMDRCSGWYKRRTQKFILVFATLLTLGMNVDSFQVADRLSRDDALRASVVAQATRTAEGQAPTTGADPKAIAKDIDEVQELGLPVGWNDANIPDSDQEAGALVVDWAGKVLGWLATIVALSLGAPFWFDVLGKLARLRNTGNREGTEKDDERAPEDRDDPSRRRPAIG
jgi:hypothetical protein